jgi:hypothetical protein
MNKKHLRPLWMQSIRIHKVLSDFALDESYFPIVIIVKLSKLIGDWLSNERKYLVTSEHFVFAVLGIEPRVTTILYSALPLNYIPSQEKIYLKLLFM